MFSRNFFRSTVGILALGLGSAVLALLGGCEGSATQTTTGQGLYGTLVDAHGTPVPGAHVKAWPANQAPNSVSKRLDSVNAVAVETDRDGKYSLRNLDVGVYNIYGETDPGQAAILIPKVKYLEVAQDLGTDTLKAPGAISGKAVDAETDKGIGLVFCYLQGSTYVAVTDSAGNYSLSGVPEGSYRMNYFSEGFETAIDSPVVVASGATTALPVRNLIRDLSLQPPAPQNITAAYDSVYGIVTLKWDPVVVADLQGYWIQYSDEPNSDIPNGNQGLAKVTNFVDDFSYAFATLPNTAPIFVRTYQVRAKDQEGNLSPLPKQNIQVRITRPTLLNSKFTLNYDGQLNTPACGDTLKFVLDVTESPIDSPVVNWVMNYSYLEPGPDSLLFSNSKVIRTSIGFPLKDTLTWSWKDFAPDNSTSPRPSSVQIRANLTFGNGLRARAVWIPIQVDANGCYNVHDSQIYGPGKESWNW